MHSDVKNAFSQSPQYQRPQLERIRNVNGNTRSCKWELVSAQWKNVCYQGQDLGREEALRGVSQTWRSGDRWRRAAAIEGWRLAKHVALQLHVEQIISSIIIYILLYCLCTRQFINNKFTQAGIYKTFCLFVFSFLLKKKKKKKNCRISCWSILANRWPLHEVRGCQLR